MNPEFKILLLFALAGLCALGLPWFAWRRVRSLEKKYGRILLVRGVSGAQAARTVGEVVSIQVIPRPHDDVAIVLPKAAAKK